MKQKQVIGILFAVVITLSGCQPAPKLSSNQDILRAQEPEESRVQTIVGGQGEGVDAGIFGENISLVIGEGKNSMRIEASYPRKVEGSGILIMQSDTGLTEERLRAFLETEKEIRDTAQEHIIEIEEEKQRTIEAAREAGEKNPEGVVISMTSIGNPDFIVQLTDGNRVVTCEDQFFLSYQDRNLEERKREVLGKSEKETEESSFMSILEAKEILLKKLSLIGISDVSLYETHAYEADGSCIYEMRFTPCLDGIGITSNFGSHSFEDIVPMGYAWVSREGVAELDLIQYCMQIARREAGETCSFDQLKEILAVYIESGAIMCDANVPYTKLELVYYPMLKKGELWLVPVWNIGIPLDVYVEDVAAKYPDVSWNIFINAVTGELIEVE